MIEVVTTCPLGSTCEEVRDNKMHRCAWYVEIKGTDAMGNEHNDKKCSMTWMPILQVEMASQSRGQTAAVESLRNNMVSRQDAALSIIKGGKNAKTIDAK